MSFYRVHGSPAAVRQKGGPYVDIKRIKESSKSSRCATKFDNVSELPQFSRYAKTNTLKQRVERHTCELCQKDCRNLVIHQVKKLKDLKGNTEWVLLMRKRRRKTLVVCPECHNLIHS